MKQFVMHSLGTISPVDKVSKHCKPLTDFCGIKSRKKNKQPFGDHFLKKNDEIDSINAIHEKIKIINVWIFM